MAKTQDPLGETRKQIAAAVKRVLKNRGLELSICGDRTYDDKLPAFDSKSGFWEDNSVTNKPPRWIVQLVATEGKISARMPPEPNAHRLGFYNSSGQSIGGIFVRIVPAILKPDKRYDLHIAWEWILFFAFAEALEAGSSAQLIEGFHPSKGTITYLERDQPYIAAALFALCDQASSFTLPGGNPGALTYREATAAVSELIKVAATYAPPSRES